MNEERDRFKIKLYGLSQDMEDFIFEQDSNYSVDYHKFYSSFYATCVDMLINNVDLSYSVIIGLIFLFNVSILYLILNNSSHVY